GKTAFNDLVYFGLGGRAPKFDRSDDERHAEVTSDSENFVELEIEIDDGEYILRRSIGRNEIGVLSRGEKVPRVFNVHPQHVVGDESVFSDWLLERLQIKSVQLFQGSRIW